MAIETLGDIFFNNYKKFDRHCAIIYNDGENVRESSYTELAVECNIVSQCLHEISAYGFIGILLEPDISLPAILLGILYCNLPFICINIQDSEEKISYLLNHLNVKWVFAKEYHNGKIVLNYATSVKTLYLYGEAYVIWTIKDSHLENKILPSQFSNNLAYAVHTSGSTGQPKIIRVPHQCILPNILDISEKLQVSESDFLFLASPLTFDPSVIEIFISLYCGATLLITSSVVKASPSALLEVLFPIDNKLYPGVSILQITPSVFTRWTLSDIQMRILNQTSTLKKLLLGGEPCPNTSILRKWKSEGNATQIFNIYGITEVSCWASLEEANLSLNLSLEIKQNYEQNVTDVPLGLPLSKTLIEVRNNEGHTIIEGEGELYVGSSERICLINGELLHNLPVPVFRASGDIVKFEKFSNKVVYIGRKNRIIKRWGHRVCLDSIETVLRRNSNVKACSCVWDQVRRVLAAIVVWRKNEDKVTLKLFCITNLDKSKVPDEIITVSSLPLTTHGKIDYDKLKLIVFQNCSQNEEDITETSQIKQILCIWKNTMGKEPLLSQNFVSSGGNSLLALQLSSELEKIFGDSVRNNLISMLLNNSSVLDVIKSILKNNNRDEDTINHQNSLIPKSKTYSDNKPQFFCEKCCSQPSTSSLLVCNCFPHGRKRKLSPDVALNKRKMDVSSTLLVEEEYSNYFLNEEEDTLIKICCKGRIMQKEPVLDLWMLKSGKKISLQYNWKFDMNKCIDASPCFLKFSKKRWVVVGSHSRLLVVLDCYSGKMISKCKLPDRIESSICPSLCGRYGVVGCYDGIVYCISFHDGGIVWSFGTGAMVKSTPTLCLKSTAIVVGSYDKNVYCINIQDGTLIWKNSPSTASIYASPCISERSIIYIATLNGMCASLSEETGKLLWKTQLSSPVFSTPVLAHSSRCIIFSEVLGVVHCFSTTNSEKMWEFKVNGELFSSLSIKHYPNEGYELIVFGCHDKHIYCLKWNDEDNQISISWKHKLDSGIFATPFLYEAKYDVNNETITYVIAAVTNGKVYVMNAEDGSIQCSKTLAGEIFSSPLMCEGQLIVGCRDNYLHSFLLCCE